jgi:hypothetical protein
MRCHSLGIYVSLKKKKKSEVYIYVYIDTTYNLKCVKSNSLHFITCTIAVCACMHMRAYDDDVTQLILCPKEGPPRIH